MGKVSGIPCKHEISFFYAVGIAREDIIYQCHPSFLQYHDMMKMYASFKPQHLSYNDMQFDLLGVKRNTKVKMPMKEGSDDIFDDSKFNPKNMNVTYSGRYPSQWREYFKRREKIAAAKRQAKKNQ